MWPEGGTLALHDIRDVYKMFRDDVDVSAYKTSPVHSKTCAVLAQRSTYKHKMAYSSWTLEKHRVGFSRLLAHVFRCNLNTI